MQGIPDWVLRHKRKGVEVRLQRGRWYAYRYTTFWDKTQKRTRRRTVEYLGVVTEDGLVLPKHKRPTCIERIREAGHIRFLERFIQPLEKNLKKYWPESWQSLTAGAIIRLCYRAPLKRWRFHWESSTASERWTEAHLSPNALTRLLHRVGCEWGSQLAFFRDLTNHGGHLAVDLTHVFSKSRSIPWLEMGYNAEGLRRPQLNLLLIWSLSDHTPGFLKLLPGSLKGVESLITAIHESHLRDAIVVGDRGLFSEDNLDALDDALLDYVIAIPRALAWIPYAAETTYKNYFWYRKRVQWWREGRWENRRVLLYLDKAIQAEEEASLLRSIEEGHTPRSELERLRPRLGTLALVTSTSLSPKDVYELYKRRQEIEASFDALKNTLEGDKPYLQSRESVQGYYFLLFLSLHLYAQVQHHLRRKGVLDRMSVHDVLLQFSKLYTVSINGKQVMSQPTKQVRDLARLLEVPVTEKWGS